MLVTYWKTAILIKHVRVFDLFRTSQVSSAIICEIAFLQAIGLKR